MYCHNFHVVLSDGDFFFARSSMSCPWVISHMMTMSPNPSSLFHRDLFYVFGDVCLYSAVSRWVSSYVVASSLWHVVIGSLGDDSFVLTLLYFDWKIPCTVHVLWWDYSQMTLVVITIKCGVQFALQVVLVEVAPADQQGRLWAVRRYSVSGVPYAPTPRSHLSLSAYHCVLE